MPGQATAAVSRGAQYVTILIGANDACTSSEASMTSVGDVPGQHRRRAEHAAGPACPTPGCS